MQIGGLIFYFLSVVAFFGMLFGKRRPALLDGFYYAVPAIFILTEMLYVLPLVIRAALDMELDSGLSPYYIEFVEFIPFAAVLAGIFNLVFSFFYISLPERKWKEIRAPSSTKKKVPWPAILILLIACYLMINQMANEFGGMINYILLGYKVTETFTGSSQYAIAFEWLVVSAIVVLYTGYSHKNKKTIAAGVFFVFLLTLMFAIMGRRGVLVVLIGASVGGYHVFVKKIPVWFLFFMGTICFLALNFIGLTRGESYQDISQIFGVLEDRSNSASEKGIGLFYTLTEGNFAIPFETFPQIIRSVGERFSFGWGEYSFRALLFIIPSFIWENRPLPLSNWYVELFYGETQKNIGRQFFILTAPYMDWGVLGMPIFGIFMAVLLRFIVRIAAQKKGDPIFLAGILMFLGNMLNLIANDVFAFSLVFFKAVGIPLLFMYFSRRISLRG